MPTSSLVVIAGDIEAAVYGRSLAGVVLAIMGVIAIAAIGFSGAPRRVGDVRSDRLPVCHDARCPGDDVDLEMARPHQPRANVTARSERVERRLL